MIFNILLLLAANIIIPYIPVAPEVFIVYCGYEQSVRQSTIYDDMNLTRHYNQDDFKKAFRQSLKRLHPDRGGNQQSFDRVKSVKQLMQQETNYYDLYNITSVDIRNHQSVQQAVSMKELFYQFQTSIFYFIALLYFIAFTVDDKLRSSRKILIPITICFCAYDFYIHFHPKTHTIFDMINGKAPLFIQSIMMKRIFCIITAIIRTRTIRIKDEEDVLLQQIKNLPRIKQYQIKNQKQSNQQSIQSDEETKTLYIKKLQRLAQILAQKVVKMQQNQQSLGTKIKNFVSKGFSFLMLGLMVWGIISSSMGSSDTFSPESQI